MLSVCSSLTTWTAFNPSFCVYEVDAHTFLPVKRSTYAVDLIQANQDEELVWTQITDWMQDYEMEDLSLSSYATMAERIQTDSDFTLSYRHHQERSKTRTGSCDSWCLLSTYCDSVTIDPYEQAECKRQNLFNWTGSVMDYMFSLNLALQTPWVKLFSEQV